MFCYYFRIDTDVIVQIFLEMFDLGSNRCFEKEVDVSIIQLI
jgi:hypothetical protein